MSVADARPLPAGGAEAGKMARSLAPRGAHDRLEPEARDPVALLDAEGVGRVEELLPLRYGRMLASPFAFYRGTASLMARDLASTPVSGLEAQLCGDAHLANFGGFASPDRRLVFDLNDFDETLRGPFEWDVKRLAASFELAGRHRGLDPARRGAIVRAAVARYRQAMREFAGLGNLAVWYARLDVAAIADVVRASHGKERARALESTVTRAQRKDSARAVTRLTELVDGRLQIVSQPPLVVPLHELVERGGDREEVESALQEILRRYRLALQPDRRHLFDSYRFVDVARKVVGVGSVGTRCWIVLLVGKDDADPLVLQVKEASASVLEPYLRRSGLANAGRRVVEGQRLMQAASDILLGWTHNPWGEGGVQRDFYVRQLWDWKASVDLDAIEPDALALYAGLCGWTLARAHARSGDRVAIAAYLGRSDIFDRAVARFATAYADVAERDHAALVDAARAGRVLVAEG